MFARYKQISKEVGYVGHVPYPTMEEMRKLLNDLSSNPTISDFKKALSLYRFLPEAKTVEQQKIVYMLQLGLATAKKELFLTPPKRSFAEVAVNYIMNLIPSLAIFYLIRITIINTDLLF